MEFNEDIASCADLVRRGDPDRFLEASLALQLDAKSGQNV